MDMNILYTLDLVLMKFNKLMSEIYSIFWLMSVDREAKWMKHGINMVIFSVAKTILNGQLSGLITKQSLLKNELDLISEQNPKNLTFSIFFHL